jgi:hypothetical protein
MMCPVTGCVLIFRSSDITSPFLCSRRCPFGRNGIRFVKKKCLISLIPLHANGNLEHKQWSLGNDKIGEDNNYKYFGV